MKRRIPANASCSLLRPAVAIVCLTLAPAASATEYHGQVLFGGIAVPGATVTVAQGNQQLSTITDTQGFYQFPNLSDGAWTLRIEMRGFAPVDRSVTISATTPQGTWNLELLPLETLLAQSHAEPSKPQPLQARPATPAATAPQPKTELAANEPAPLHPSDDADQANDGFLVNGSENNAATSKYSIAPGFGNRRPGAKSLYTGSAGAIADNSLFDARPYSLTGLELPKASYSRITGILTLGGPLKIPHVLPRGPNFFVAYQWTRNRVASTETAFVPTQAERSGDLSGLLNSLGQPVGVYNPATGQPFTGPVPVSPQAAALLDLYPLPNLAGNNRYNYQTQVLSNTHTDALQSRLDKSLGRRDSLYGGFSLTSSRSNNASLFNFLDTTNTLGLNGDVHWSHRLPHQTIANLSYTFSRQRIEIRPNFSHVADISGQAGITGNDQDPADWGPPTLAFSSGIATLSDVNSTFNRNRTDGFAASAVWTHRRHNVTFGGDFCRREFNELTQQNPRGSFTFTGIATQAPGDNTGSSTTQASTATGSDFADFLLGVPDASNLAYGNADKYFRQPLADLYVTDDWRIRSDLTINAGIRWDYGAPLSELKGRLVNLDVGPNFANAAPVLGSNPSGSLSGQRYPSSLIHPDHLGFQPRVGVSWRPLPASTLVVRAGFGVYDDTSVYLSAAEAMAQQAPLSTSLDVSSSATCPLTLANGFRNCGGTTADTFGIDPNFRVGYAQTWQLALQRDLPGALVITATYLGIKGTRGMQDFLPNTYAPGATDPYPGSPRGFVYRSSTGDSTRESGQVQLRRRLRSGLQGSLQYTYSKSLDNDSQLGGQGHVSPTSNTSDSANTTSTSAPTIAQNWLDLRRGERGLSTFDQRHLLRAQLQYTSGMGLHGGAMLSGWRGRLLKQWTAATTISAGSGLPETPIYDEAVPGTGFTGTVRPNLTGRSLYRTSATPAGYFLNASAYSAPTTGQWGNARRNSITGPDQFSLDTSLSRTFKLARINDRTNLDVRLDASNLLNHVTFTTWNTLVNSSTFGLPTSSNAMRSMQLTGRFRF